MVRKRAYKLVPIKLVFVVVIAAFGLFGWFFVFVFAFLVTNGKRNWLFLEIGERHRDTRQTWGQIHLKAVTLPSSLS